MPRHQRQKGTVVDDSKSDVDGSKCNNNIGGVRIRFSVLPSKQPGGVAGLLGFVVLCCDLLLKRSPTLLTVVT